MPDTQAMPAKDDAKKGAPDGVNEICKGPESGGGDYPNDAGKGDRLHEYSGPKNDGSEGGETIDRD